MVNATSIDMSIVTGTFRAIGDMYGPIMPVMKNMGRKLTITASVALMSGGRISATASSTMSGLALPAMFKMPLDVLDVNDRIVHEQTQGQDQGEQRHAIDRVAEQQIDGQRQSEHYRHRDGDDKGRPPAHAERQQRDDDQDRDGEGLDQVIHLFVGGQTRNCG